ncbi:MAG: hypothetical protein KAJ98_14470 [Spirochaetaceae bacterium]|nr:hypothetical protein [Spirochaetaceae bacterium]
MEALNERIARIEDALLSVLPDAVDSSWLARVAGQDCPEASPSWADSFLEPGEGTASPGGQEVAPSCDCPHL